MATCPRCRGALTENHRCPHGRFTGAGTALVTVLIGSALGTMLCYGIETQPTAALVMASAALGAVLANAVRQALGHRA